MRSNLVRTMAFTAVLSLSLAAHANPVANGGFEAGSDACSYSIPSWSGGGFLGPVLSSDTSNCLAGYPAHSGTKYVAMTSSDHTVAIAQDIPTVAGQSYHLQFFLKSDGVRPNEFGASWDGLSLLELAGSPGTPYVEYNFDVVATDAVSTLRFSARTDFGYWLLDDVSLVAIGAVPEPESFALFTLGLATVALTVRRRRARLQIRRVEADRVAAS